MTRVAREVQRHPRICRKLGAACWREEHVILGLGTVRVDPEKVRTYVTLETVDRPGGLGCPRHVAGLARYRRVIQSPGVAVLTRLEDTACITVAVPGTYVGIVTLVALSKGPMRTGFPLLVLLVVSDEPATGFDEVVVVTAPMAGTAGSGRVVDSDVR